MSVNKVILIGRLGQNPEVKYAPSGMPVCTFSIATTESWKDKNNGQKVEKTEWHRVVAWAKLAEICGQYLSKGKQVFIEGRIQTRSWDDKDGTKRYMTEILAQNVQFIGAASSNNNSNAYPNNAHAAAAYPTPGQGQANNSFSKNAQSPDGFDGMGGGGYGFYPELDPYAGVGGTVNGGGAEAAAVSAPSQASDSVTAKGGYTVPTEDQFSSEHLPF
ncbi:MAG: single-stranded DNA-binding protein [Oligoflexia bacterium]|nr:single-stranded DNA-binding protein [Oligoflexia bacterium]